VGDESGAGVSLVPLTPYYEDSAVQLFHGDCRAILPTLAPVDHVITDPPYSEYVHSRSRRGGSDAPMLDGAGRVVAAASFNRVKEFGFEALTPELRLSIAIMVGHDTRRWVLVFSDTESAHLWSNDLVDAGLEYIRTLFWRKVGGTPQFTGDRPAVACEAITACHRAGRKRWNGGGKHGFYDVPIVRNRGGNDPRVHTTQKPLELMTQLVADFTDPGDLILDPFAGSGTTLVAAKRLGRRAIGIELDERYCASAAQRLAQGALELFPSVAAVDPVGEMAERDPTTRDLKF